MVIGDDVALGIDDEAGAERFLHLAVVAAVTLIGNLAAEEAVEEVLEIVLALTLALSLLSLILIVVVAGILGVGLDAAVRSCGGGLWVGCLGSVWVLMFTTAGPTSLAILTNVIGRR